MVRRRRPDQGFGLHSTAGVPSRDETARGWHERTGRSTEALDYYEVFAGLRFTIIMLRMGKLLEGIGLVPATFPYDNFISDALEVVLDRTR